MMKMNEENQGAEDRSVGSVVTPKLVCSKHRAWPGTNQTWQDLLRRVFLTHTPWGRHICRVQTQRASFGLQFVKKKKQKTNFIKTENFFSFQIVNLSINVTHVVV